MHHRFSHLRFILAVLLISTFSCEHGPIEPVIKDPREYEWTIDTLSNPSTFQRSMITIWASSAQDVYVGGFTDGARGKMYHYDGNTWTPVKLHILEGGPFPNIRQFGAVFGFSSSDIFAVGSKIGPSFEDSSFIIHFDGTGWSEQPAYGGSYLQAVWGSSPLDVWAGGTHGSLFHYNGSTWERYAMPDSLWFASITGFSSNDVYASAYQLGEEGLNTHYYLHWNGGQWEIKDSFVESPFEEDKFGTRVVSLSGKLYSIGAGVYKLTELGWVRIFGNKLTGIVGLCGVRESGFFAVGIYGSLYHFNGNDWFQYSQFVSERISYWGCWTDGEEVFVVGSDGFQSFVLHGK